MPRLCHLIAPLPPPTIADRPSGQESESIIPRPEPSTTPDQSRDRAVAFVLWATLALNLGVAAAKIVAGLLAGSLSVEADGYHSLADGMNNVVALVGLFLASQPPDANHPYGHRKHEIVAAALIGAGLLAVAWRVGSDAFARLGGAVPVPAVDGLTYGVLLGTLGVNLFVTTWERRRARALGSALLASDAAHTRSDVVVTAGVLVSAWLLQRGYMVADIAAAFAVAAVVGVTGVSILGENLGYLSDRARVDPEAVLVAARAVAGVRDAHHVRSRGTPGYAFVDLHVAVDADLTLREAHAIGHAAADAIKEALTGIADVTVHTEPCAPEEHARAHDAEAH